MSGIIRPSADALTVVTSSRGGARLEAIAMSSAGPFLDPSAATAPPVPTSVPTPAGRLAYLPASFFGAVMGLSGLAIAWRLAAKVFGLPSSIAEAIAALALLVFMLLVIGYAIKWIGSPAAVRAEFQHPIAANFFATFIISVLLLPVLIAPYAPLVADAFWWLGTVLMFGFAWLIVRRWMSVQQQLAHATPAWIIPVVGTLDIPIAGVPLALPGSHVLSMVAVSVGLFFTLPLFTMILSRLIFETPIPRAMQPSLMILVAPFAVGFSAYVNVAGQIDMFALGLFYLALFMFAVLLPVLLSLPACPFRISWWAVSFPLAALTIASLKIAAAMPADPARWLAAALLAFTSAAILALAVRTVIGVGRGELRTLTL